MSRIVKKIDFKYSDDKNFNFVGSARIHFGSSEIML